MSDPSEALQVAQFNALVNDAALMALLAAPGVWDTINPDAPFPYVQIGESQVLGDDTDGCGDGSEVITRTHAYTRGGADDAPDGLPPLKKIAAEVRRILKAEFALAGFTVTVVEYVQTQFLRDPDGQTMHAVIEHRYLIDHAT